MKADRLMVNHRQVEREVLRVMEAVALELGITVAGIISPSHGSVVVLGRQMSALILSKKYTDAVLAPYFNRERSSICECRKVAQRRISKDPNFREHLAKVILVRREESRTPEKVIQAAMQLVKGKNPEFETEQLASIRYRGELYSITLMPDYTREGWKWRVA